MNRRATFACLFAGIAVWTVWSGLKTDWLWSWCGRSLPLVLWRDWDQGGDQKTVVDLLDFGGIKNIGILGQSPKKDYPLFVYRPLNVIGSNSGTNLIRTIWADHHIANLYLIVWLIEVDIVRNGTVKIFDRSPTLKTGGPRCPEILEVGDSVPCKNFSIFVGQRNEAGVAHCPIVRLHRGRCRLNKSRQRFIASELNRAVGHRTARSSAVARRSEKRCVFHVLQLGRIRAQIGIDTYGDSCRSLN